MPARNSIALEYRQLRQLARAIGELEDVGTAADLQAAAFFALASFAAGSLICFEKFSLEATKYEVAYNGDPPPARHVALFGQLYQQHPYIEYLRRGGTELAVRPADLIGVGKWRKTELYNELYIPNGAPFGMCSRVFIPESSENLNFTLLRDREFSDAEQAVTRVYLEETRRVFARVHLSSDPMETLFITHCRERGLTKRETEVITQAFKGKTDKEIAQALGNGVRTVQAQLQAVYRKVGVRTRVEAMRRLLEKSEARVRRVG